MPAKKKITDVIEVATLTDVAQVKDKKDLVRDMSTNAVINKNKMAYLNAKKRKETIKAKEAETVSLKQEVEELKALVAKLLNNPSP